MAKEDEYREPCTEVSVSHGMIFLAEQSHSERLRVEQAVAAEHSRIYREVVEPLLTKLEKGGTKACIWCEEDPHFTGCPVATAREQMEKR